MISSRTVSPMMTKQRPSRIRLNQWTTQPTSVEVSCSLPWCTHTHLTALFPGLPGWTGTRKVKPIWFTEARDSEWQWHQVGHMQVCISLQTDNQASTPPLSFFTDQMPFLPPNQQHWWPCLILWATACRQRRGQDLINMFYYAIMAARQKNTVRYTHTHGRKYIH